MRTRDEQLHALIAEQAAEWYVAHRDGALAPAQQQAFMHWLRASPVHVAEYLSIASVARDIGDAARQDTTPLPSLLREAGAPDRVVRLGGAERASISAALSPREHLARTRRKSSPVHAPAHPRLRWVFAMLVLVAAGVALGLHWFASQPQVQRYATRHGELRSLQLPDNTVVRLNSDSGIEVRFDRHHRRVVVTRGEAYFEVAKDPARSFSVQVDGLLIKDIGTSFDIYRQGTDTTVTVAEGQVQVWRAPPAVSGGWFGLDRHLSTPQGRPIVDLTAGHQARIAATGGLESQGAVDVQRVTAWTQGNIAFENQPIAAVAAQFNRYNNQQISVDDPRIAALPISGTFDAHDVATFVAFLDSLPGVKVKIHGSRVRIVAAVAARHHRR